MNFFEVMLIKPGDEVTVRAIVTESMRWTSIEIDPCISMGNILLHRPTPPKEFEVGDMVRNRHCATPKDRNPGAPIMAIADGWAMVKFWNDPTAIKLDNLELAK